MSNIKRINYVEELVSNLEKNTETVQNSLTSLGVEVDGKVDKSNIITTKNSSATDDQVYSAKAINTELGGINTNTFKEVSSISEMTNKNDMYILNTEKNVTKNIETFSPKYVCGANNMLTDMPGEYDAIRGIGFKCEQGVKYTVTKSSSTNRFRLVIMTSEPETWTYHQLVDYTILDSSDTSLLKHTFTCEHTGYCLFTYSNTGESATVTVNSSETITVGNLYKYSDINKEFCEIELDNLHDIYVQKKMPIDTKWEKWKDVRYSYGMRPEEQPIFNTINGVLESDTMISVRGGKGRWHTGVGSFVAGSHVFEGWSGNEKSRLTMLIGKFHETFACIQTYSPAGLYETNRRFGWVKLGSDELNKGVDFSQGWTNVYTPLTLNVRDTTPSTVPDYDLNPQLTSNLIPVGTMYYDSVSDTIKVYTAKTGWRKVALAEQTFTPVLTSGASFEVGTVSGSTGELSAQDNRVRTIDFIDLKKGDYKLEYIDTSYNIALRFYNSDETFYGTTVNGINFTGFTTATNLTLISDFKIKILVGKSDNSNISSDGFDITKIFQIKKID